MGFIWWNKEEIKRERSLWNRLNSKWPTFSKWRHRWAQNITNIVFHHQHHHNVSNMQLWTRVCWERTFVKACFFNLGACFQLSSYETDSNSTETSRLMWDNSETEGARKTWLKCLRGKCLFIKKQTMRWWNWRNRVMHHTMWGTLSWNILNFGVFSGCHRICMCCVVGRGLGKKEPWCFFALIVGL